MSAPVPCQRILQKKIIGAIPRAGIELKARHCRPKWIEMPKDE